MSLCGTYTSGHFMVLCFLTPYVLEVDVNVLDDPA